MNSTQNIPEGLYPIRVVSRLTGLSADTIRAWERRYNAVTPARSQGKSRRYTSDEVRKILLIQEAMNLGHKLKDVAGLEEERLRALLAEEKKVTPPQKQEEAVLLSEQAYKRFGEEYLAAIERFEVHQAATSLARAAALMKPLEFVYHVVVPLLQKTGNLWEKGQFSVAQEHLVSEHIRGCLANLVNLTNPQPGAQKILIATPEGQRHEFGALIGALLTAHRGLAPIYLGANVPLKDIFEAAKQIKAEIILLSIKMPLISSEERRLLRLLRQTKKQFDLWLGLPEDHPSRQKFKGARVFTRFEDLDMAITDRLA